MILWIDILDDSGAAALKRAGISVPRGNGPCGLVETFESRVTHKQLDVLEPHFGRGLLWGPVDEDDE